MRMFANGDGSWSPVEYHLPYLLVAPRQQAEEQVVSAARASNRDAAVMNSLAGPRAERRSRIPATDTR